MSDDRITISINDAPYAARKGQMIIQVADANGVTVPRFCYHEKLSVAANCRMCLVEVEKAPKPLPACATPVADGMKVWTKSVKALDAQQGVMEFLLINHPLDCPICDEGGECRLQDTALGFGKVESRYQENKRVVDNENIGPLIATEMTRCIHCTRCVRFGQEVAGLMELGGTGRGEHMRIGTYIAHSVESELSGNMIDLCPVGALTSKPFRYTARSWELERVPSVAPHDCAGSNLEVHTAHGKVMRVVPKENPAINEIWLSDRDRFAYLGVNSAERLQKPKIKRHGQWHEVEWQEALDHAANGLRDLVAAGEPRQLGALLSPTLTTEEVYLAQRLMRGLGSDNVDHRLREADTRDQAALPAHPGLESIAALESLDAVLLIGSDIRKDQPSLGQRLRKGWRTGGTRIAAINSLAYDSYFDLDFELLGSPSVTVRQLAGVLKAALAAAGQQVSAELADLSPDDAQQGIARMLRQGEATAILLGSQAIGSPQAALLRSLARRLAAVSGATFGELSSGGNGAGAWLAGGVPHRGCGTEIGGEPGLSARDMIAAGLTGYLLCGVEPEYDCADPVTALAALARARFVVSLTAYGTARMREYADVLLPIVPFTETAGSFVNAEGRWQSFKPAVKPLGQARPGWKVLRVLGNLLGLADFEYAEVDEITHEIKQSLAAGGFQATESPIFEVPAPPLGLSRIGDVPLYRVDGVVRRSGPLQARADSPVAALHVCGALATERGLTRGQSVRARQGDGAAIVVVTIDERVPPDCVYLPAGVVGSESLGLAYGPIEIMTTG